MPQMTFRNWLTALWVDIGMIWRYGLKPHPRDCSCGCDKPEIKVTIDPDK